MRAQQITDATFHAFVDGRLSARADREVATALETDHASAARAATWRRQSEALRAAFDPVAEEPLPLAIILKVRDSLPERRLRVVFGIALAAFTTGLAVGVGLMIALGSMS